MAGASVDRVECLRLWVERCDDMGNVFMTARQDATEPDGGLYIYCHQDGTSFYFAGDAIDFRSLNTAISENVREEFEVVVTGRMCQVAPEVLEQLSEELLSETADSNGNYAEPDWSEKELARMRRESRPIHIIEAESLVVNL
jgi:hypothetical protein